MWESLRRRELEEAADKITGIVRLLYTVQGVMFSSTMSPNSKIPRNAEDGVLWVLLGDRGCQQATHFLNLMR